MTPLLCACAVLITFIRAGYKRALSLLAKGQTFIKENRCRKEKYREFEKVGIVRWRERERGGGGNGQKPAESSSEWGLRSDRRESGGSN